jgi:hypothetical protein
MIRLIRWIFGHPRRFRRCDSCNQYELVLVRQLAELLEAGEVVKSREVPCEEPLC